jgi:hypothetical protein
MDAATAQARFEVENNVREVDGEPIYKYDQAAQKQLRDQKPWTRE